MALRIQENVPLAPLTTLGVGGPARYFIEAASADDIREALAFASEYNLTTFVLGGGSNLVVSDEGFSGLVIRVAIRGITGLHDGSNEVFEVGAGEDWDTLVAETVKENCAGLECLSGIPGTVGGTPVQNVGAYGQDVSETISSVEALDVASRELRIFTNRDCGFAYRTSIFNTTERGRFIITKVSYALRHGGAPKVAYADLKRAFAERSTPATIVEVREAVLAIRRSKGMVVDSGDQDSHSAGSFFKNPVLTAEQHAELNTRAAERGLTVPSYPALEAQHKVPAAWLIENSGFKKGFVTGRVGISSKHSLAIINRGGAMAADVTSFKESIQRAVAEQFGVELRPEPVFLGFDDSRK